MGFRTWAPSGDVIVAVDGEVVLLSSQEDVGGVVSKIMAAAQSEGGAVLTVRIVNDGAPKRVGFSTVTENEVSDVQGGHADWSAMEDDVLRNVQLQILESIVGPNANQDTEHPAVRQPKPGSVLIATCTLDGSGTAEVHLAPISDWGVTLILAARAGPVTGLPRPIFNWATPVAKR